VFFVKFVSSVEFHCWTWHKSELSMLLITIVLLNCIMLYIWSLHQWILVQFNRISWKQRESATINLVTLEWYCHELNLMRPWNHGIVLRKPMRIKLRQMPRMRHTVSKEARDEWTACQK